MCTGVSTKYAFNLYIEMMLELKQHYSLNLELLLKAQPKQFLNMDLNEKVQAFFPDPSLMWLHRRRGKHTFLKGDGSLLGCCLYQKKLTSKVTAAATTYNQVLSNVLTGSYARKK